MNIAEAKRSFAEAVRYATFFIEFQSSLNLSYSFGKVPIQSVYDFKLNYAKLPKSRHFGSCGTGSTVFGTSTKHFLYVGTGTTCLGTGTKWFLLSGTGTTLFWYRYHLVVFAQKC